MEPLYFNLLSRLLLGGFGNEEFGIAIVVTGLFTVTIAYGNWKNGISQILRKVGIKFVSKCGLLAF